jgi:hypothetical protein
VVGGYAIVIDIGLDRYHRSSVAVDSYLIESQASVTAIDVAFGQYHITLLEWYLALY